MCLLKMVEKGETIKRREREPQEACGNKRQARSVIINMLQLRREAKGQTGSWNRHLALARLILAPDFPTEHPTKQTLECPLLEKQTT